VHSFLRLLAGRCPAAVSTSTHIAFMCEDVGRIGSYGRQRQRFLVPNLCTGTPRYAKPSDCVLPAPRRRRSRPFHLRSGRRAVGVAPELENAKRVRVRSTPKSGTRRNTQPLPSRANYRHLSDVRLAFSAQVDDVGQFNSDCYVARAVASSERLIGRTN
jgi:hypothetical protein